MRVACRSPSLRHLRKNSSGLRHRAFEFGAVCAHRGWTSLRPDDLGHLWEHYVLNELTARLQTAGLRYWRDKQGHEVDLI